MNKFRLKHKLNQAFNRNDSILEKFFKLFDVFPRIYYVVFFFGLFAFIIILRTFGYTIINHTKYTEMAERQQTSENVIDVNRGSIYSDNEKGKILATSVDLNDLAVDPSVEGNKVKLTSVLTDLVYSETCKNKARQECYDNMLIFLKQLKIDDFNTTEEKVKSLIKDRITEQINRTKVTSVVLRANLTEDEKFELDRLSLPGISIYQDSLYANPEEIDNPEEIAPKLLSFFKDDEVNLFDDIEQEINQEEKTQEQLDKEKQDKLDTIAYLLRKRDLKYVKIFNKLSIGASSSLEEKMDKEQEAISKGIISSKEAFSNFIILEPHQTRFYPERFLASQVLGFLDNSNVGRYGIEAFYNDILNGKQGKINYKRATSGIIINPAEIEETQISMDGADIVLTIDRTVQNEVEQLLEKGVKEFKANKGNAIVMDPKTGDIIAMADYPSYDPNNFGDVYEIEKVDYNEYDNPEVDLIGIPILIEDKIKGEKFYYKGKTLLLREASDDEIKNSAVVKYKYVNDFGPGVYTNDAISELYEPGSIFKPIIISMGLESGDLHRFDMYQDKGYAMIDEYKITNVSSQCAGYHSYQHALNYSCNTGMINMIQKIGDSLVFEFLNNYGFGQLSGITLDGEVFSEIDPFETWSRAKLFTTSFGRGMVTTPLKIVSAYATMANKGIRMRPNIVKEIRFTNGVIVKGNPIAEKRVLSEETADIITEMLVDSVENGLAANGKVDGYLIAGKTGTSGYVKQGKYEEGAATTVGSFAGYGPAEDPQFVVVIKLDRPRTSQYGGNTSAHIFNRIASFLFDYYNIPKNANNIPEPEEDN